MAEQNTPPVRTLAELRDAVSDPTARIIAPDMVAEESARTEVTAVEHDSRRSGAGTLFCCISGATADGHDFAADVVAAGATALLVERVLPNLNVPQLVVSSVRESIGEISAAFWGNPSTALTVIGVTGTNGKTTVTHLLERVLAAAGKRTALIGTLSGVRTTPEATELQATLAQYVADGFDAVAMEVSSHALEQGRVTGTRFSVAVFTNLSRDHLDYHETMEAYFSAKALLFTPEFAERAAVNLDDPRGRLLRDAAQVPTVGYAVSDASSVVQRPTSTDFVWLGQDVALGMGGEFNLSNALAAASAAQELGIAPAVIAQGLSTGSVVSGRFEPVECGQPFAVIVDYAHTPDALEKVLESARPLTTGRVLVVFGAGGDRDQTKRPQMGEIAATLADHVFITSDNPRGEDPVTIIEEIERAARGVVADAPPSTRQVTIEVDVDRRSAISAALAAATPDDIVVVAGKGHEAVQVIGETAHPFDDRLVCAELLVELGWSAP